MRERGAPVLWVEPDLKCWLGKHLVVRGVVMNSIDHPRVFNKGHISTP
jgi:hypothetical protein